METNNNQNKFIFPPRKSYQIPDFLKSKNNIDNEDNYKIFEKTTEVRNKPISEHRN